MLSMFNDFNPSWYRLRICSCDCRPLKADCWDTELCTTISFRAVLIYLSHIPELYYYWTFCVFPCPAETIFYCLTKPRISQTVIPLFKVIIYSQSFFIQIIFILILCRLTVFYVRQLYHNIFLLLCRQYNIIIHIRSPQ